MVGAFTCLTCGSLDIDPGVPVWKGFFSTNETVKGQTQTELHESCMWFLAQIWTLYCSSCSVTLSNNSPFWNWELCQTHSNVNVAPKTKSCWPTRTFWKFSSLKVRFVITLFSLSAQHDDPEENWLHNTSPSSSPEFSHSLATLA